MKLSRRRLRCREDTCWCESFRHEATARWGLAVQAEESAFRVMEVVPLATSRFGRAWRRTAGYFLRSGSRSTRFEIHWCFGAPFSSIAGFSQRWWCVPPLAVVARGETFSVMLVLVVYGRTDALLLPPSYLASLFPACVPCSDCSVATGSNLDVRKLSSLGSLRRRLVTVVKFLLGLRAGSGSCAAAISFPTSCFSVLGMEISVSLGLDRVGAAEVCIAGIGSIFRRSSRLSYSKGDTGTPGIRGNEENLTFS
ncbi:hypothetical protein DY000_02032430 [Brassica cretica]|uniref:Uncharacterized protein n=1 Tax=Brassica cretica TaxID=69181 RepID=A0ABQ7DVL1_BRACR|nr:hypothetical protein DY000_02032430 [Brassica cretica]